MGVVPYRTAQRPIDGVLVTFTDITRIAETEAHQEELRRRIDALLRTVLDIAERSLDSEPGSIGLHHRLRALSSAYNLISGAGWGDVPLAELATKELADYGIGREGRVAIGGPPVLLRANVAINLAMALHELAAWAAAEGALSVPQGRVHLDWAIEPADGAGETPVTATSTTVPSGSVAVTARVAGVPAIVASGPPQAMATGWLPPPPTVWAPRPSSVHRPSRR
jgi:two-component sensor histidine kinase